MFAKLEGGQLHLDRHILPYRFSFGFHPFAQTECFLWPGLRMRWHPSPSLLSAVFIWFFCLFLSLWVRHYKSAVTPVIILFTLKNMSPTKSCFILIEEAHSFFRLLLQRRFLSTHQHCSAKPKNMLLAGFFFCPTVLSKHGAEPRGTLHESCAFICNL